MAKELKNVLVNCIHDRHLREYIPNFTYGRLVDTGCATKPHKTTLVSYVTEYIGLDTDETPHDKSNIDSFGTACAIPEPDASFDCALRTPGVRHPIGSECPPRNCIKLARFHPCFPRFLQTIDAIEMPSKPSLKYLTISARLNSASRLFPLAETKK